MSYLVLARKWRPQTFTDLVGQEHVARTLQNAIAQGRLAHAFLFTGARGVGKTTIARILAKALNCLNADGPTGQPCAKCAACEEIARSGDVDVKEIDGASNNSVDDVRRLQETLPYMPSRDRHKVVIIDEVHMLSTGAFNALLKTLEEPPPHVKFIFATTEVHKVPITILSRCQRYDFKLLPTQKIRERIEFILKTEGIGFDAAAVNLVAREAAGSMRDALSLLDQVIAGSNGTLVGADASRLLGVADRGVLYELVRALLAGDAPKTLSLVHSVATEGHDITALARDFLALLRDLVVAKVAPDTNELLDLSDEERADVLTIARSAEAPELERLFAAWSRTVEDVARAREPRWVVEMALVRLAHRPALVPVDELLNRLADLERKLSGGGGESRGAGSGPGNPRPSGPGAPPQRSIENGAARGAPVLGAPGGPSGGAPRAQLTSVPTGAAAGAAVAARPAPVLHAAPTLNTQPAPKPTPVAKPNGPAETPAKPRVLPNDALDVSGAAACMDAWDQVVARVENTTLAAMLKHAVPVAVSSAGVRLAYEGGSFYARKVSTPEFHAQVAEAVNVALGPGIPVEVVAGFLPEGAPTLARREDGHRNAQRAAKEDAARTHPFVKQFVELVGGEVRSVRLDDQS